MKAGKYILFLGFVLALSSCCSTDTVKHVNVQEDDYVPSKMLVDDRMSDMLSRYLQTCRDEWLGMSDDEEGQSLADAWFTHWTARAEYKIVYASERFISFWADEWSHEDSNRSNAKLSVGTLLRSSGRRLHLQDLYSTPEEAAELKAAWDAAVKRGNFWYASAEYNPGLSLDKLENPFMTENFYVKGSDIHFIYQTGEVASNFRGAVEVVVHNWKHGAMAEKIQK